jgi:hypothetical protein
MSSASIARRDSEAAAIEQLNRSVRHLYGARRAAELEPWVRALVTHLRLLERELPEQDTVPAFAGSAFARVGPR